MIFNKIIQYLSRSKKVNKQIDKDMNNVISSVFLCNPIYDKLKIKCHPDRFIDENKKQIAEKLFKELQECRFNYDKLLDVEVRINEFIDK
jgi:hypothetical protein